MKCLHIDRKTADATKPSAVSIVERNYSGTLVNNELVTT